MAKIYQYRKKVKGEDWQNCTKQQFDGFNRNRNMKRLFETREAEDIAEPTPNAKPKTTTRKKKTTNE